jgi:hypothetical protein
VKSQWPSGIQFVKASSTGGLTIFTFQGTDQQRLLKSLPVILQPFIFPRLVDWQATFRSLPAGDVHAMLNELFAVPVLYSSIAQRFRNSPGFGDAIPTEIRISGQSLEVRLHPDSIRALQAGGKQFQINVVEGNAQIGGTNTRTSIMTKKQTVRAANVGIITDQITARNVTGQKSAANLAGSVDNAVLVSQLDLLLQEMRKRNKRSRNAANARPRERAIAAIGDAHEAAAKGDVDGLWPHLKKAGSWARDVAVDIGKDVAAAAINKALGQ